MQLKALISTGQAFCCVRLNDLYNVFFYRYLALYVNYTLQHDWTGGKFRPNSHIKYVQTPSRKRLVTNNMQTELGTN